MNNELQGIGSLPKAAPIRRIRGSHFLVRGCGVPAAGGLRLSFAARQSLQVRSKKRTTSCRTVARLKIQSVAVIFLKISDDPVLNFFEKLCVFPLDKAEKQPMMWRKVGRSGQQ